MDRHPHPDDSDLRASALLGAIARHGVRCVVVGSYGAIVQSAVDDQVALTDLDITPARDPENLERLVSALVRLGAQETGGVGTMQELREDPTRLLDAKFWTFRTEFGGLDLVFSPAGFAGGYEELIANALKVVVADEFDSEETVEAVVACARDIYESKRQAGRAKDRAALAHFTIHRDKRQLLRDRYRREIEERERVRGEEPGKG